jgi:hypothetical protein
MCSRSPQREPGRLLVLRSGVPAWAAGPNPARGAKSSLRLSSMLGRGSGRRGGTARQFVVEKELVTSPVFFFCTEADRRASDLEHALG